MAAISLLGDTNMAAVTSRENTIMMTTTAGTKGHSHLELADASQPR